LILPLEGKVDAQRPEGVAFGAKKRAADKTPLTATEKTTPSASLRAAPAGAEPPASARRLRRPPDGKDQKKLLYATAAARRLIVARQAATISAAPANVAGVGTSAKKAMPSTTAHRKPVNSSGASRVAGALE
jgi:hypothetical protein